MRNLPKNLVILVIGNEKIIDNAYENDSQYRQKWRYFFIHIEELSVCNLGFIVGS